VEHFKKFQDFVVTFPLYRGKAKTDEDRTDVGEFKVNDVAAYQLVDFKTAGFVRVLENLENHGIFVQPLWKVMENVITIKDYESIFIVYHDRQNFHWMYFTELWISSHGKDG